MIELLPLDSISFYVIVCIATSSVNHAKLRSYYCSLVAQTFMHNCGGIFIPLSNCLNLLCFIKKCWDIDLTLEYLKTACIVLKL